MLDTMDAGKSPPPQQQQAVVGLIGILALVVVVAGFLVYRFSRTSKGQTAQAVQVGKQRLTLLAPLLVSEAPFVLIHFILDCLYLSGKARAHMSSEEMPSQWCQDVASSLLQWPFCKALLWLIKMQELQAPGAAREAPQTTTAN